MVERLLRSPPGLAPATRARSATGSASRCRAGSTWRRIGRRAERTAPPSRGRRPRGWRAARSGCVASDARSYATTSTLPCRAVPPLPAPLATELTRSVPVAVSMTARSSSNHDHAPLSLNTMRSGVRGGGAGCPGPTLIATVVVSANALKQTRLDMVSPRMCDAPAAPGSAGGLAGVCHERSRRCRGGGCGRADRASGWLRRAPTVASASSVSERVGRHDGDNDGGREFPSRVGATRSRRGSSGPHEGRSAGGTICRDGSRGLASLERGVRTNTADRPQGGDRPLARRGDDAASLRRFFDEAMAEVYPYLFKRCGRDRDAAQDVTQETFIAAVSALRRGVVESVSIGWMMTTARSRLIDHYRQAARRDRPIRLIASSLPAPLDEAILSATVTEDRWARSRRRSRWLSLFTTSMVSRCRRSPSSPG